MGTFLTVLPDFWVYLWLNPGFLGKLPFGLLFLIFLQSDVKILAIIKEPGVCQMILQFSFLFYYGCAKSFQLSSTAISLSYGICSAFQN